MNPEALNGCSKVGLILPDRVLVLRYTRPLKNLVDLVKLASEVCA
jgi:hypothetical protein